MPTICCQILIFVDKFYWFFYQQLEIEFWKIPVRTKYELIWTCFSRTLVTDKGANIVQNICLTEQPFWAKLPVTVCETFIYSKFVCIWFLILHTRIQSWKESQVAAIESFSIDLKETIVRKCSKKRCIRNNGGTYALFYIY